MKVLNYGSANLDYIFTVDHIAAPGETIASQKRELCPGGKGLNQSVALAKAGAEVYHAGTIGKDGEMLKQVLHAAGVSTEYLRQVEEPTGNAMIQVDSHGQNCIVLYAGANHLQTAEAIERTISDFGQGDLLLLQNEINGVDMLIDRAYERGMTIALNPSPFNRGLESCDLNKVGIFILNEVEGEQLTGEKDPDRMIDLIGARYPQASAVLTLGVNGSIFGSQSERTKQPAYRVEAVDTTAAGDTFTGFFLEAYMRGVPAQKALALASAAAALSVCSKGASSSIPTMEKVENILCGHGEAGA